MTKTNLNQLILDLKKIEFECLGDQTADKGSDPKKAQLDPFQCAKRDLCFLLKDLKENIKRRNDLQERIGPRNEDVIRMKNSNQHSLDDCNTHFQKMKTALEKDRQKVLKNKKSAITQRELETRIEITNLIEKDLQYAASIHTSPNEYNQNNAGASRNKYNIARNLRAQQQQQQGKFQIEEQKTTNTTSGYTDKEDVYARPLTHQEQLFIDESNQRDQQIDAKLDQIHVGVRTLGKMAEDINTELKVQDGMIEQVDEKIDQVQEHFDTANMKLNRLLDQSGGVTR